MGIRMDSPNRAETLRLAARMAEEAETFGRQVRRHRKARGWTQRELAARLEGKTEGKDISRYEKGHHLPSENTRLAIARALGVALADLYAEPELQGPTPDLMGALSTDESLSELRRMVLEAVQENSEQLLQLLSTVATLESRVQELSREIRDLREALDG